MIMYLTRPPRGEVSIPFALPPLRIPISTFLLQDNLQQQTQRQQYFGVSCIKDESNEGLRGGTL